MSTKHKVEATNTWALSLYTYYLPMMEWKERELLTDRMAHFFNASAERCHHIP